MPDTATQPRAKFHISLNVRNLLASVAFYRVLFGAEPAKQYDDYAKFEVEDPPVVFSLSPQHVTAGGVLRSIGILAADEATLAQAQRRLGAAGISCHMGHGLRVADPDGNEWVFNVPGEDLDPSDTHLVGEQHAIRAEPGSVNAWEHRLSQDCPGRIPHDDASLDEVRLQGTFNADLSDEQRGHLVREAWRVLRPGGKVVVHGLAADKPLSKNQPALPGLAALVSQVPLETKPLAVLRAAGFVDLQIVKLSTAAVFVREGVEMREQKLLGWKAEPAPDEELRSVLYQGPFAQAVDDEGNVYGRGRRMAIPASTWNRLRESASAEQFSFLEPTS